MKRSTPVRKSVSLSPEEEEELQRFLEEGSSEREQLIGRLGEDTIPYSESSVIAALVRVGTQAIREGITRSGYQRWAQSWTREDEAWLDASASWAEEAWDGEE
jgi:hypothetical protein